MFVKDYTRSEQNFTTKFKGIDLKITVVEMDRADVVGKASKEAVTIYVPLVPQMFGMAVIEVLTHELVHIEQMIRDGYENYIIKRGTKEGRLDYEVEAYTRAIINIKKLDVAYQEIVKQFTEIICFTVRELKCMYEYHPNYTFILPHSLPGMSHEFYDRMNFHLVKLFETTYTRNKLTRKGLEAVAKTYAEHIKSYKDV